MDASTPASGVCIYNYNKSPLEAYRGVKFIELRVDERLVGVAVRALADA